MARDILSEYGSDTSQPQSPRATTGGVTETKELPYSEPQGPKGIPGRSVGLGGDNHGNCGSQGRH